MSTAKKTGNIVVWIILLLLVVGLGGFGVTNFGGTVQSIGRVGDTEITVDAYARELNAELRALEAQTGSPVPLSQAMAFGLADQARGRTITSAALDNEAARIGVSVGDEEVGRQIVAQSAFQGTDGEFDRESYRFLLQQNGLTEAEYEAILRTETARTIVQGAILAGVEAPAAFGETIYDYIAARRSYGYLRLTEADLDAPVGLPDEAALQAYYEANELAFTAPETRDITYAWLTPAMLLDSVEVDEDALRALYDERAETLNSPERRLVERLVFPSAEEAAAARARLDAGKVSFADLVAERGLELADIDLGDVTEAELGAAGEAVFALGAPGVAGPVETEFGPALIRMNAILEAQQTSFDDIRDDLREELARDRAARVIGDMITDIDDRLAAGATLEELAEETEMQLGRIAWFDGSDEEIAAYDAFRAAARAVAQGDFPEVDELDDGGIFALRLDGVTPPALRPLEDVRDEAIAGWQAEETRRQLIAKAEALKLRLDAGEAIEALGPADRAEGLTRAGIIPEELAEPVFTLAPGESTMVGTADGVYLLQLAEVLPPDAEDVSASFLRQSLEAQAAQGIAQDLFVYFAQSLVNEAGLTLDQAAINAVHAQFP